MHSISIPKFLLVSAIAAFGVTLASGCTEEISSQPYTCSCTGKPIQKLVCTGATAMICQDAADYKMCGPSCGVMNAGICIPPASAEKAPLLNDPDLRLMADASETSSGCSTGLSGGELQKWIEDNRKPRQTPAGDH
jgi:hypothetical protein